MATSNRYTLDTQAPFEDWLRARSANRDGSVHLFKAGKPLRGAAGCTDEDVRKLIELLEASGLRMRPFTIRGDYTQYKNVCPEVLAPGEFMFYRCYYWTSSGIDVRPFQCPMTCSHSIVGVAVRFP